MTKRIVQALLGAAALATIATPAMGQAKREGYEFLEAVRKRDGDKATQMLSEPGNVLVNSRDLTSGETALHVVTQRRDATWMRYLLQQGANPNIATTNGTTPLQLAVQLGYDEGVEILLDHGAQVDPTDSAGETPLIAAVHRGDVQMIRALIAKGANPERSDNSGRTAHDYAVMLGARSPVLEVIDKAIADRKSQAQTYGPN